VGDEGVVYLRLTEIVRLHALVMECSDQQAADQVRDVTTLGSSLARPLFHGHYRQADIATQAAVLAHGIAESQSFIDGNKRTAFVATLLFLRLNGFDLDAPMQARYDTFLALADGSLDEAALAAWLERDLRPSG